MNPTTTHTEPTEFTIDAIAMKRRIQEQMYEETKNMAPDEFIAYIQRRIAQSQFADFLNKVGPTQPHVNLSEKTE